MHPLDKLHVHAEAIEFTQLCYRHARCISELDLRSQLLRSARSIAANLAEGAGSQSQAVFARYVAIALASGRESESHIRIGRASGQLSATQHDELLRRLSHLMPRMYRLHSVLRANAKQRARTKS